MTKKPTRVALYLRVSTTDKGQDVENQRQQLSAFCEEQGYKVVREYVDNESGTKGKRERYDLKDFFGIGTKKPDTDPVSLFLWFLLPLAAFGLNRLII